MDLGLVLPPAKLLNHRSAQKTYKLHFVFVFPTDEPAASHSAPHTPIYLRHVQSQKFDNTTKRPPNVHFHRTTSYGSWAMLHDLRNISESSHSPNRTFCPPSNTRNFHTSEAHTLSALQRPTATPFHRHGISAFACSSRQLHLPLHRLQHTFTHIRVNEPPMENTTAVKAPNSTRQYIVPLKNPKHGQRTLV